MSTNGLNKKEQQKLKILWRYYRILEHYENNLRF